MEASDLSAIFLEDFRKFQVLLQNPDPAEQVFKLKINDIKFNVVRKAQN